MSDYILQEKNDLRRLNCILIVIRCHCIKIPILKGCTLGMAVSQLRIPNDTSRVRGENEIPDGKPGLGTACTRSWLLASAPP